MRMLARLLLGLFVLKAAVATPRFSRQTHLDYDTENGDYDYELTTNLPIEVETLSTELEAEEEEEEEVPLKPQLTPQGSGGSGVLMGPDTQKEVELRLTPIDILHVSGDSVGSGASGVSGESGTSASGESGGSGGSGDIVFISGASQELQGSGSGSSGEFLLSGDILFSGDVSGSGEISGSGDVSGSSGVAIDLGSGESGDLSGVSGTSGISGASGESGESGFSGITFIEGEGLPLIPGTGPSEASGASGEFSGISGISGVSGEASGDIDISGASGTSGVSASGEPEFPGVTLIPDKEEGLLPTTTQSPEEGKGEVEGPESSGDTEETPDRQGMPTCLLCTCLGGSVYCDDLRLDSVPPLPKETTHFYARYNRITKIYKSDFANMGNLKRIDLTANEITTIDEKAFIGLPELEELVIRENHISQLPALPETMTLIDASHNNIGSKGIHQEAFKDMTGLQFLYMTDNNIDYIPVPLPDSLRSLHLQRNNIQMMHEDTFCNLKDFNYIRNALEDIRLDGNPINLSRTPQAYVCLPRIPIGTLV